VGSWDPQKRRFWVQTQWRAVEKLLPASSSAIELDFGGFYCPTSCQVGSAVVCFKRKKKKENHHHHHWIGTFLPWMNIISLVTSGMWNSHKFQWLVFHDFSIFYKLTRFGFGFFFFQNEKIVAYKGLVMLNGGFLG
jgi:hypothetical protein